MSFKLLEQFLLISLSFLIFSSAGAAELKILKKEMLSLKLDSQEKLLKKGDSLDILTKDKVKIGRVTLTAVRYPVALAKIEAGQLESYKKEELIFISSPKKWTVSLAPKFFLNQISVVRSVGSASETVAMTGINTGFEIAAERFFFEKYSLNAGLAYDILKLAGAAQGNVCDGNSTNQCYFNVSYLTLSSLAKINFFSERINYWLGAGVDIKTPVSKKTNAINSDDITYGNDILIATGINYKYSDDFFIPLAINYAYSLNTSDKVPVISQIAAQIGIAYRFN